MRNLLATVVFLTGTLCWWGFLYPELCMTEGSCQVIEEGALEEEGSGGIADKEAQQNSEGEGILAGKAPQSKEKAPGREAQQSNEEIAGRAAQQGREEAKSCWHDDVNNFLNSNGRIRIKSRVLEYLYQVKEEGT